MSQNPSASQGAAPPPPLEVLFDAEIQLYHQKKQTWICQSYIQDIEDELRRLEDKLARVENDPHNAGCVGAIKANIKKHIDDKLEDLKALKRMEAKLTGGAQSSLPQQANAGPASARRDNSGPTNTGSANAGAMSSNSADPSPASKASATGSHQEISPRREMSMLLRSQIPQVQGRQQLQVQVPAPQQPNSFRGGLNIGNWVGGRRSQEQPEAASKPTQPPPASQQQAVPIGAQKTQARKAEQARDPQMAHSDQLAEVKAAIWKEWSLEVRQVARSHPSLNANQPSEGPSILRSPPGGFVPWREFENSKSWDPEWTKVEDALSTLGEVSSRRIESFLDEVRFHWNQIVDSAFMPSSGTGMITKRGLESFVALGTALRAVERAGLLAMPWIRLLFSRIELKCAEAKASGNDMRHKGRRLLEDICHPSAERFHDKILYEIYQAGLKLQKAAQQVAGKKRRREESSDGPKDPEGSS